MLNGKPVSVHGATFRPGDMIAAGDTTFLVHRTDQETNEVCIYNFEDEYSVWLDAQEWLRAWFTIQTGGAQVWRTLCHETKQVLVDGQLVPHTFNCHLVTMPDPPEDHPKHTYCLSWEETKEHFTYPVDGHFAKYESLGDLTTAVGNIPEGNNLDTLAEWYGRNETIADYIDDLPQYLRGMTERISMESEQLSNSTDDIYEILFKDFEGYETKLEEEYGIDIHSDTSVEGGDPSDGPATGGAPATDGSDFSLEWIPAEDIEDGDEADGAEDADADDVEIEWTEDDD